jgi:hypothetical protein
MDIVYYRNKYSNPSPTESLHFQKNTVTGKTMKFRVRGTAAAVNTHQILMKLPTLS